MPRIPHQINLLHSNLINQQRLKFNLQKIITEIDLIQIQFGDKPSLQHLREISLLVLRQIVASEQYLTAE